MNLRAMVAILRKDLLVVLHSKVVLIPTIAVPLIILVLLPGIGGAVLANTDPGAGSFEEFQAEAGLFFENLPAEIAARLARYDDPVQQITYIVFNLFFPPMYLLLPTMVANVFAADSFAGEKERKTLEALLYTPTTDRELYLAKLAGPWLSGIVVGVVGYLAFAAVTTLTTYGLMGEVFVLDASWLLLVFWVSPAAAGLGLGAMVLVSSRVSRFQEAYQLGGMVVIPILLLFLGQFGGLLYFTPVQVIAIGAVLWAATAILVVYGARTFERGALLARL